MLSAGTTVQVLCYRAGLQVADGKTAWYELASYPDSADPYFNRPGVTSGSPLDTPVVDPAEPSC